MHASHLEINEEKKKVTNRFVSQDSDNNIGKLLLPNFVQNLITLDWTLL
jgi:hypothetical protein